MLQKEKCSEKGYEIYIFLLSSCIIFKEEKKNCKRNENSRITQKVLRKYEVEVVLSNLFLFSTFIFQFCLNRMENFDFTSFIMLLLSFCRFYYRTFLIKRVYPLEICFLLPSSFLSKYATLIILRERVVIASINNIEVG